MRSLIRACLNTLAVAAACAWGQELPLEPPHDAGTSITGAFEGWFKNSDGSFSFLLGYYNRNQVQEVDIPIGTNNRIEPGGPDRGQPTFFLPGRQWGMFTIKVPKDFGESKLTWTITANGATTVIPMSLKPDYEIEPFREVSGNTPPSLGFAEHGPMMQGPAGLTIAKTAKLGAPLALPVWVADDLKVPSGSGTVSDKRAQHPVTLIWSKYRGPGEVTFSATRPEVDKTVRHDISAPYTGTAATSATFSQVGEYVLHVVANDYSGEGGGGFQCCWTTGDVKVSVQP